MDINPAIMCLTDGPETARLRAACIESAIWGCFSTMELNPGGMPYDTGLIIDAAGEVRWGVEDKPNQFGHCGYVAVKGGARDCPLYIPAGPDSRFLSPAVGGHGQDHRWHVLRHS